MQNILSNEREIALVNDLLDLPSETPWVEFKQNNIDPARMAKTASALANGARLADKPFGYMVWGVNDDHEIVGTRFGPHQESRAANR